MKQSIRSRRDVYDKEAPWAESSEVSLVGSSGAIESFEAAEDGGEESDAILCCIMTKTLTALA